MCKTKMEWRKGHRQWTCSGVTVMLLCLSNNVFKFPSEASNGTTGCSDCGRFFGAVVIRRELHVLLNHKQYKRRPRRAPLLKENKQKTLQTEIQQNAQASKFLGTRRQNVT